MSFSDRQNAQAERKVSFFDSLSRIYQHKARLATDLGLNQIQWPSPSVTDTFDRYDVTIGGITWHVKDGYFLKSLSAKQSS